MGNTIDSRITNLREKLDSVNEKNDDNEIQITFQLSLFQKLVVFVFKLPVLRYLPKWLNNIFSKIIYYKSLDSIKESK